MAAAGGCSIEPDETEGSRFVVSWELQQGAAVVTCEDAAVPEVVVRSVIGVSSFEDIMPCEDGGGETAPLPAGSYAVTAFALDEEGFEVGLSAPQSAELREIGDIQVLAPFAIELP